MGSSGIRSRETLEEAIQSAIIINSNIEQKACIICNPDTKQYWLSSNETEGLNNWIISDIENVKIYYQTEFNGNDPFGLELLNYHQ